MVETRVIAQMKGLLILIKCYKKHICQKLIFDPLLGPERQKLTQNHEIGPIYNIDSAKSINAKA